jgi:hypothetical protein
MSTGSFQLDSRLRHHVDRTISGFKVYGEPVPKLIDCALTRTVLAQALAVFQAKAGLKQGFSLAKPRFLAEVKLCLAFRN